jgi:hypothetical protein
VPGMMASVVMMLGKREGSCAQQRDSRELHCEEAYPCGMYVPKDCCEPPKDLERRKSGQQIRGRVGKRLATVETESRELAFRSVACRFRLAKAWMASLIHSIHTTQDLDCYYKGCSGDECLSKRQRRETYIGKRPDRLQEFLLFNGGLIRKCRYV